MMEEQQAPQSREELIHTFCMVAVGSTPQDAEAFLELCKWNVEEAIGSFMDKYRPIHERPKPPRVSDADRSYSPDYFPMPRQKYLGSSSKDVVPKIDYSSLMELVDVAPMMPYPSRNLPLASQFHPHKQDQTGSSSSSMGTHRTQIGKSFKEADEVLYPVPISIVSPPQFNEIQESRSPDTPPMDTWVDRICNETKMSRYEAINYLERSKWNFGVAMEACRSKTSSSGVSVREISSQMITPLRSMNQPSNSLGTDSIKIGKSLEEAGEETFTPHMKTWVDLICNETKVSRYEALYYLEGFKWNLSVAMEACRNKTFPSPEVSVSEIITPSNQLSNSLEQLSLSNNERIDSFLEAACGATREEAITCLKLSDGDVNQAVGYFLDRFSNEETTAAMTISQWQLQASHGSQNQGYSNEGIIGGSSSSSVNAEDLNETGLSLEEAGKEKATVAIPGMASSQLDINLNVKAGEEDTSMETFHDACALQDSIMLELVLASGTLVKILFRLDQTVGDIHDAIDERTPENDKDYLLQSTIGEDYRDMNTTVSKIISAGSATLIQIFHDH